MQNKNNFSLRIGVLGNWLRQRLEVEDFLLFASCWIVGEYMINTLNTVAFGMDDNVGDDYSVIV